MELIKQYEILLKKSYTDIEVSKLLIESKNCNIDQEVILFHLQQATEKLIKCLLVFNEIEKLVKIGSKNKIEFFPEIKELEYLTDFAVVGRYEFIGEDLEEINSIFNLVIDLKNFVEKEVALNEIKRRN